MSAPDLDIDSVFNRPLSSEEVSASSTSHPTGKSPVSTMLLPVPADAPAPPERHPQLGRPSQTWAYRDANGGVLYYVFRFETSRGKEIRPLTLWRDSKGRLAWEWKAAPENRPLYGLDKLAAQPEAEVLIVEGEKAADAAALLCPDKVVVTSSSGADGARHADWSPLAGRSVVIWPDNDVPGQRYAHTVAAILSALNVTALRVVDCERLSGTAPNGSTRHANEGWDAADALKSGWTAESIADVLADCTQPWSEPQAEEGDPLDGITSDPLLKAALPRLASLKPGDYALERKAEAKRLGITVAALDSFVRELRGDEAGQAPAQRDLLLSLAKDAELWRDPAGEAHATVVEDGCRKNFRVRSGDLRSWLTRLWMRHHDEGDLTSAPAGQALQDAANALEAKALIGAVHEPFVRIGHLDGNIYIDLGDERWRAVKISSKGWQIITEVPVRFVRPSGMLPLPEPVRADGARQALLALLPDGADAKDARTLLLSFIVGIFMPHGSLPLLALSGRQGSGKSTLTRRIRSLVDPNQAPARQQPRSEDDLIIAARNGALIAFDNLSHITPELSDALCRLATGSGFSKRRLYTDGDEVIVQVRRPVIVNGITDLVRMPDLADRAIFVELPTRSSFAAEKDLEKAFEEARPAILALLYDAVSASLRGYASETGSRGIRLADFERWARAAAPVLGLEPNEISVVLGDNRLMGDRMLIDDDIVASALQTMLTDRKHIEATATHLLGLLREQVDQGDQRLLPKGPRALSGHLRRFVPAFERIGILLTQKKVGHERQRVWEIRYKDEKTVAEEF